MANTKIPVELSSTPGIVDGSNATAITIDSSEQVGIGTTSPFSKTQITETGWSSGAPYGTVLTVTGNNTNDANWGHLIISDSSTGTGNGGMLRFAVGSTSSDISPHAGIDGFTEGSNYGGLKFLTRANGGTAAEKMRITSAGNVGLGTTAPTDYNASDKLTIANTSGNASMTIVGGTSGESSVFMADGTSGNASYRGYVQYQHTNDNMNFGTAGSERMRIDSSGRVMVGTTDGTAKFNVGNGSGNAQIEMASSSATAVYYEHINRSNTNGSVDVGYYARNTGDHKFYTGAYTVRFTINENGGANGSDEKLKKDIENISYGLDTVKSLQPRKFKWKETENDGIGFIAQEVESLIPEVVSDTTDVKEETGEITKVLNYANLTAVLTKAIQEQQAIIETQQTTINDLKSRIETLEG